MWGYGYFDFTVLYIYEQPGLKSIPDNGGVSAIPRAIYLTLSALM